MKKLNDYIEEVKESNPDFDFIKTYCSTEKDYIDFYIANFSCSKYIARKLYKYFK